MSMKNLYESKKKMEEINKGGKKKIKVKPISKRKTFEEKHKRVTTYLEIPLYKEIQSLRDRNKIKTMTEFVNSALKEYIKNNM